MLGTVLLFFVHVTSISSNSVIITFDHIFFIQRVMVSTAEELKAEDELLNETPAETTAGDAPKAGENGTATTTPPAAGKANGKANGKGKKGKKDEPEDETHVTEFDVDEHSKTLLDQMQKFREEKDLNDGHLVFASEGKVTHWYSVETIPLKFITITTI